MRSLQIGLLVLASTAILPALALAGNQEKANQIKQALDETLNSPDPIYIKVQRGTVVLSGQVSSQEQINQALKVAGQTHGITRVVSQLTVRSQSPQQSQAASEEYSLAAASSPSNNPLRGEANEAGSFSKSKLAAQLQAARAARARSGAVAAGSTANVERVPSSFSAAPAAKVSDEEVLAEPEPTPAQRVRPLPSPNGAERAVGQAARGPTPIATTGAPLPMYSPMSPAGASPIRYDQPRLPNYAWPSYAAYPNYAAVTYPKQYSPTVWPYIGPFYPYPQVPLGWRKVSLEWSDGWWFLDFKDLPASAWQR